MGRTKVAVSEVYEELKERAKEVGLNIRVEKIKVMVQNRRTRRMREILTIKYNDI
jgi:predicted amino acid-binding ACT domain protein